MDRLLQLSCSRRWLTLAGAIALGAGASGCVPLVVGGVATAGVLVAVDRRTSGTQL